MEQLNTIIEQWHERIGPLQQKAAGSHSVYLSAVTDLEKLTAPTAQRGATAPASSHLRRAFGYALRAPALLYRQDLARLGMQRDQAALDRFIAGAVSQLAAEIHPALEKALPQEALKVKALQEALDAGTKARSTSDIAAISCAQAAGGLQWASNRYYFNALQRSRNSARDLDAAKAALRDFNTCLSAAGFGNVRFDDFADVAFAKFGPEHSAENNTRFTAAQRRLEEQRAAVTAQIDVVKAGLLDALDTAAGNLGVKTRAFENLIAAAHRRIDPPPATIGGAPPKADF